MGTFWKWSESGTQLLDATDGHTILKILASPATQEEEWIRAIHAKLRPIIAKAKGEPHA